jgi:CubicO group peptidase (beta-lactamase class C family)
MKRLATTACVVAAIGTAVVSVRSQTPPALPQATASTNQSRSTSLTASVDGLFAQWNSRSSPGCSLGVSQAGTTVYERGYGMANLELGVAITPASVFHVASIAKQFTAMSILLLAEQGRLSVDDEVRKYITELPDYGTRLTIRHLLTHTSGLRGAFALQSLAAPRDDGIDGNEAIVRTLARQQSLNFAPGAQYQYNNSGYTMLGHIVKRVSGQSLRAFAETNIFKPLGMTNTYFNDDPGMIVRNRASGYTADEGTLRVTDNRDTNGVVGNAGLFTTARDLLLWEQNFANARVGDRALIELMQTPAVLANGTTIPYGLGLEIGRYRGARTIGHGGDDPGYVAHVVRYPDQGFAVALLCNLDSIGPATSALTQRIADVYLATALTTPSAATTTTSPQVLLSAADLTVKAGRYRDPVKEGLLRVFVLDGKLRASPRDDGDSGRELVPVSATRFRLSETTTVIEFVPAVPGRAQELHFIPAVGEPRVFQQLNAFTLASAELRRFAGLFTSPELEVTYTVVAREADVVLQIPGRAAISLRPIATDTFTGAVVDLVKFSRDARGDVSGFTVNRADVRDLRFDRVKAPG